MAEKDKTLKHALLMGFIAFNDRIRKPDEWWDVCIELGTRSERIITKLTEKRKSQQQLQISTEHMVR